MTPNASKQGQFGSLGSIFCSYFCLVCGGWGFKRNPGPHFGPRSTAIMTPSGQRFIAKASSRLGARERQSGGKSGGGAKPHEENPTENISLTGTQSTTLFGDHPFSIKHPQDNFGPQNVNGTLQNVNWPSKKGLASSNLQFWYRNTQKSPLDNLYFGGHQFAFWRLKLSWGGFIEKGGPPKRVVL